MCEWVTRINRLLYCREDAVRLGLFIGGFTGSYHLIFGALNRWQGNISPAHNCMAAGTAAGHSAVLHLRTTSTRQSAILVPVLFPAQPAECLSLRCLLVALCLLPPFMQLLHVLGMYRGQLSWVQSTRHCLQFAGTR